MSLHLSNKNVEALGRLNDSPWVTWWQVVEYEFLLKSNWQQRKTAKGKMAFTIHKYFTYIFLHILIHFIVIETNGVDMVIPIL